MYNIHGTAIQQYAQESANNLSDVILMVALSIQQNWSTVGYQMQDVKTVGGVSRFLWGNKKKTYNYLQTRKDFMYGQFMAVVNSKKSESDKAATLMQIFLRVPGLGLAKAGFVCQLAAGLVGCIDTHNIRMYGIDEKHLKLSNTLKSQELKKSKINQYVNICHSIGTEQLWNNWCNFLGDRDKSWNNGFEVSEAHYNYLVQ